MGEGRTSSSRVSVYDAAQVMGVTVDAIRKRISRGTIPHERDEDGRVWVLLDTDQDSTSRNLTVLRSYLSCAPVSHPWSTSWSKSARPIANTAGCWQPPWSVYRRS